MRVRGDLEQEITGGGWVGGSLPFVLEMESDDGSWQSLKVLGPNSESVAKIMLNLPAQANALTPATFSELPRALRELDYNTSVRVIVIGAVGKHFCAGIDLRSLAEISPLEVRTEQGKERELFRRSIKVMQDAFTAIELCRKPVLASIHGACVGGGVDLITACDLRYTVDDAKFSVKEVDLAITADLGTLQRLPVIVGYSSAIELALTARNFDGIEAKKLGLVHESFPSKEVLEKRVDEIATEIARKSPIAIMGTKAVLLKSRDVSVEQGLDFVALWNTAFISEDVKESMTARLEKRTPRFSKL